MFIDHARFQAALTAILRQLNLTRIISEVRGRRGLQLGAAVPMSPSAVEAPEYNRRCRRNGHVLRLLEAIRFLGLEKKDEVYQARPPSFSRSCRNPTARNYTLTTRAHLPVCPL